MDFKKIEQKWLAKWQEKRVFEPEIDPKKQKFFVTFPFPYMNGGPHIGHTFSALRADSYARFKRLQGYNVLFPFGFHATGEAVFGSIERIQNNDPSQINTMKLYGVTEEQLQIFKKDVKAFVRFWMQRWQEEFTRAGISVDWRRSFVTTQMTPTFSRFIEWQYDTLRSKDYVTQGSHPVIWCPHCKSPTGDHDRLKGEGESIQEYTIIKFRTREGYVLPAATLRPETIYGVTNLWINPFSTYVKASIKGETWILSEKAYEKIKEQKKDVDLIETFVGQNLIGSEATNPATNDKLFIFQAEFVDPEMGTGVVMSVPAHAPYDYIALEEAKRYSSIAKDIEPIKVIETEGYDKIPAKQLVDELAITSQIEREKLDKATETLYKKEFHTGKMIKKLEEFGGQSVEKAKEKISKSLSEKGVSDILYEPTGTVVCRCGTTNIVKLLENQWFLKYSDPEWKAKAKRALEKCTVLPEESRAQFLNTIDWLKDKACTRKSGLGTPLPWDPDWIVETLSDSTIYMAYYTFAHILKQKNTEARSLSNAVLDYILLGKPIKTKLYGIDKKTIELMRKEFNYWYPVNMRGSGKDLIQNHLTFFLFHHAAIFPEKNWPRGVSVNGFVNVEGQKMSKSLGNVIPLFKLLEEYGADNVRINIVASAEDMQDADWRAENMVSYKSRVELLNDTIKSAKKYSKNKIEMPEAWLMSRMHAHIKSATAAYDAMKFRSAAQTVIFDMTNDLKWYLKRTKPNGRVVKDYLKTMVVMLSPLMPFTCEELWEKLNEKGFASLASWPKYDRKMVNQDIETAEAMVRKVIEDIEEVKKIAKIENPKRITLFITAPWKYEVMREVFKLRSKKKPADLIKHFMKNKKLQQYAKELPGFINNKFKMSEDQKVLNPQKEYDALSSAKEFIEKELKTKVEVVKAQDSQHAKARAADVMKPGILIE